MEAMCYGDGFYSLWLLTLLTEKIQGLFFKKKKNFKKK
jgi:hypothetical protein